jgi:hypothetical protein
MEIPSCR